MTHSDRAPDTPDEAGLVNQKTKRSLLGEHEEKIWRIVKGLRTGGSTINAAVVTSVITTVLSEDAPHLLQSNGGAVNPASRSLRQQFYKRHNLVKRAATSTRKQMSAAEMQEKRDTFIRRVEDRIRRYNIPDCLVINFDETNLPVIPTLNFTMVLRGTRNVSIAGKDHKKGITGVIGCARDGARLDTQVIFGGKTSRCEAPKHLFPSTWDITHTESHWSTNPSKRQYGQVILMRYIRNVRRRLGVSVGRDHALVIYDFHRTNTKNVPFVNLLTRNRVFWELVPPGMTDSCQVTLTLP